MRSLPRFRVGQRMSAVDLPSAEATIPAMGFNRRKMEDQRDDATDAQVLEDAERLIAAWNERQAKRMPMLFSPTICAAIKAGYWFEKARARTSPQSDHTFSGAAPLGVSRLKC